MNPSEILSQTTLGDNPLLLILLMLWVIPWKGYALWVSAKNGQKYWFLAILVINTFAILEIYYIFFGKKELESKVEM